MKTPFRKPGRDVQTAGGKSGESSILVLPGEREDRAWGRHDLQHPRAVKSQAVRIQTRGLAVAILEASEAPVKGMDRFLKGRECDGT